MNAASVAAVVAIVGGIALLGKAFGGRKRTTQTTPTPAPEPEPLPTPPPLPVGWVHASLNQALIQKAVEILRTNAPIGSLVPFTHEGQQYAGFITWHGPKRAVEIVRPA